MPVHPPVTLILTRDTVPSASAAARLHARLFPDPWSEEDFESLMASPAACFYWIQAEGEAEPLGLILVNLVADEGEILTFGVCPEWRRRGVACSMLQQLMEQLEEHRISQLLLEVDTANQAALGLYGALGFETIATRKGYYPRKGRLPADAYVMRKSFKKQ